MSLKQGQPDAGNASFVEGYPYLPEHGVAARQAAQ